jgi:hypothetical protein
MTSLHSEISIVNRYDERLFDLVSGCLDLSDIMGTIDAILINVIREARASV